MKTKEHVGKESNNNTLIYDDMKNEVKTSVLSGNVGTENHNGLKDSKTTTNKNILEEGSNAHILSDVMENWKDVIKDSERRNAKVKNGSCTEHTYGDQKEGNEEINRNTKKENENIQSSINDVNYEHDKTCGFVNISNNNAHVRRNEVRKVYWADIIKKGKVRNKRDWDESH